MNITEAYRCLAEKYPEKFVWSEAGDYGTLFWLKIMPRREGVCIYPDGSTDATQDDKDEILAQIGYYYEIITVPPDIEHLPEPQWGFILHRKGDRFCNCIHSYDGASKPFETKSLASDAAVIAVAEYLKGEG